MQTVVAIGKEIPDDIPQHAGTRTTTRARGTSSITTRKIAAAAGTET
jgi:hypothetical protein